MLIIKGMIIGLGKIIPGVSGSMLAISLGVYEELIESLNNILKFTKLNIKFLIKIIVGILISIIFFSNIINNLLNRYYFITMLFFVGLIIGGFADIKGNISSKNSKVIMISFLIALILGIIGLNNDVNIKSSTLFIIYFLFIGIVDAFNTVIPGISGTATLMMLGAYRILINSFSTMFNFNNLSENSLILIPFFIGFVIGVFLAARLIQFLISKNKSKTYSSIYGVSIATVVLMLLKTIRLLDSIKSLLLGLIFLVIGILITKKINHIFNG